VSPWALFNKPGEDCPIMEKVPPLDSLLTTDCILDIVELGINLIVFFLVEM
jgi:hypothetical protein